MADCAAVGIKCSLGWQESVWVTGDLPILHELHDPQLVQSLKADVSLLERKLKAAQVKSWGAASHS